MTNFDPIEALKIDRLTYREEYIKKALHINELLKMDKLTPEEKAKLEKQKEHCIEKIKKNEPLFH